MSGGRRFAWAEGMAVADRLIAVLAPVCERIEVAGSLRRRKATVGDVELLYIPRESLVKVDFFSLSVIDLAGKLTDEMLKMGLLEKRLSKTGVASWGAKNRLALHTASGIPVDFFATTEENWWVSLVIRTGGKETNLALTTGAQRLGRTLHAYGCGTTDRSGQTTRAGSERDVFDLCGVEYREPEERP